MPHPYAAQQRNTSLKLVLLLPVKMGAVGIPEVGLPGITKSLSSETLRAWESLIYGARCGHDIV